MLGITPLPRVNVREFSIACCADWIGKFGFLNTKISLTGALPGVILGVIKKLRFQFFPGSEAPARPDKFQKPHEVRC